MAFWPDNFASPPPNMPLSVSGNFRPVPHFLSPNIPPQYSGPPPPNLNFPPPCIPSLPPPQIRPPILDFKEQFHSEEIFLKSLEARFIHSSKPRESRNLMKISEVKDNLLKCFDIFEEMESLANCLQITYKSISNTEWDNLKNKAESKKMELTALLAELKNPEVLSSMKAAVMKRSKKRAYKKRKLREWQEEKRVSKLHAEQESRRIDLWMEQMKDQVSRAKREEDIKREADLVLSDVTSKKTEAKKMLNILNSLSKLRSARAQALTSSQGVTQHDGKAFYEVIDRLKQMWLTQIKGYSVEEAGLRLMLGHAEEERASLEATQIKKNLKSWSHVLFGAQPSSSTTLSFEELTRVRWDWDQFVCPDDFPMASSIPNGWIIPSQPSSQDWSKLLSNT